MYDVQHDHVVRLLGDLADALEAITRDVDRAAVGAQALPQQRCQARVVVDHQDPYSQKDSTARAEDPEGGLQDLQGGLSCAAAS